MPTYDDETDKMGHLMDGLAGQSAGSIERAEAQGQRALVASSDLPKDMSPWREEIAEHTGIQFHDDLNDLFVRVTLPDGWSKKATDHSMWSILADEQGRERASIFYKAAFYDRSAHISFSARYGVRCTYDDDHNVTKVRVLDGGGEVVAELPADPERKSYEQTKVGYAWLDENYPQWRSPWAYWDLS